MLANYEGTYEKCDDDDDDDNDDEDDDDDDEKVRMQISGG